MSAPEVDHVGHAAGEPCTPLRGPEYPADWTTCLESAWHMLCEEVDIAVYVNGYAAAGGQRAFDDWRAEPCCTCSQRHTSNAEAIRPPYETARERERACLDSLARAFAKPRSTE